MNFKREFTEFLESDFFLEPGTIIDPHLSLAEQGVVDSMGLIEISLFLHKRYGIMNALDQMTDGTPLTFSKIEQIFIDHSLKEEEL